MARLKKNLKYICQLVKHYLWAWDRHLTFYFACCFCSGITWSQCSLDHSASHFCGAHKALGQPWSAPVGVCIVWHWSLFGVIFVVFSGLSAVQEQVNCVRKRCRLQWQPLSTKSSRLVQSVFSVDNLNERTVAKKWAPPPPPPPPPHKLLLHL